MAAVKPHFHPYAFLLYIILFFPGTAVTCLP